ncbi:MAG: glycosyl hydrolase, partial [Planctomycetes bacterium]|nr:glycosyl hydrolase [Planctomycetota bacterium]
MRSRTLSLTWRLVSVSFLILATADSDVAPAASLKPQRADAFFITPEESVELRFQVDAGEIAGPLEYVVRDYAEKAVDSGSAERQADGTFAIRLTLKPGFFDIHFPATGQRFGVVAIPSSRDATDDFFCIDSAMSWLVREDAIRQSLVRVLRRSGIRMSRERLSWAQISPGNGAWQWDGGSRYEALRNEYAANGLPVLEMCHDAPGSLGHRGKYPDDLVRAAEDWKQISQRWRATWGALEVWNEPDIFFGDNLPADQYVALVRTVANATAAAAPDLPLVGGVVAHNNRAFLTNAATNGLLENVDAFSFHTYGRAPAMEALVDDYRTWLAAHDHPSLPLWLTECGRPWPKGTDRPDAAADQVSALDITMKAVEARCCGVQRYFAFVYPFYEERENNFGMMGRRATPLRSMAAYVRLTSLLANKAYLGDLPCDDPSVIRSRVFGDENETVAVVYVGQPKASATIRLGLPVLRAEGIDGRLLEPTDDGRIPVPDGLVYLWLDRRSAGPQLLRDTQAMRLWITAQAKSPR